jgi:hypothetical protein
MTVDQRDYVRLGKQDEAPWEKKGAPLFSGVSQADHDALMRVHLKGKGKNMTVLGLISDEGSFDPVELEARDQSGDLKRIVQVIESELWIPYIPTGPRSFPSSRRKFFTSATF